VINVCHNCFTRVLLYRTRENRHVASGIRGNIVLPGWNSLGSVKRIASFVEAGTLVFWSLLVMFEITAHFSSKKLHKVFNVLALIAFAVAVSGEIVEHKYQGRKEKLYDAQTQELTENLNKKLQKASAAASQAQRQANEAALAVSTPLRNVQKSPVDVVQSVGPAVVQVAVVIKMGAWQTKPPPNPLPKPIPQSVRNCFPGNRLYCIDGTGFFVNPKGDVVTASHVADDIQDIRELFTADGIPTERVRIGVSFPNFDNGKFEFGSGSRFYPAVLTAIDREHDIAVFHVPDNPFAGIPSAVSGNGVPGFPQSRPTYLRIATSHPSDGEQIFACGFPFGESGLVSTFGEIASAWKSEVLPSSKRDTSIDAYWVDLRVNPGNSGGPVLRMADHAVLGLVVGFRSGQSGMGIVVPAKYIANFLTANKVQWSLAKTTQ
jgi:S1-C subfamily serine protease